MIVARVVRRARDASTRFFGGGRGGVAVSHKRRFLALDKNGADNGEPSPLSVAAFRRRHAEKREGWFRVWPLQEPKEYWSVVIHPDETATQSRLERQR